MTEPPVNQDRRSGFDEFRQAIAEVSRNIDVRLDRHAEELVRHAEESRVAITAIRDDVLAMRVETTTELKNMRREINTAATQAQQNGKELAALAQHADQTRSQISTLFAENREDRERIVKLEGGKPAETGQPHWLSFIPPQIWLALATAVTGLLAWFGIKPPTE